MWYYDAERVLSAIAKFLVHLVGEEKWQSEMGGKRRKGVWKCEKRGCTKK